MQIGSALDCFPLIYEKPAFDEKNNNCGEKKKKKVSSVTEVKNDYILLSIDLKLLVPSRFVESSVYQF